MAVSKKERIINQMDIEYYDGLNKSLNEQYILKLEQEIRSWSIIFNNLIKQDALIHVLECAANEVSKRVKEINKIKNKLTKSKIMEWISVKDRLPEKAGFVIAHKSNGLVLGLNYNADGEFKYCKQDQTSQVTHWMPLPEPPKE